MDVRGERGEENYNFTFIISQSGLRVSSFLLTPVFKIAHPDALEIALNEPSGGTGRRQSGRSLGADWVADELF